MGGGLEFVVEFWRVILGALIAPEIFMIGDNLNATPDNPRLWAARKLWPAS